MAAVLFGCSAVDIKKEQQLELAIKPLVDIGLSLDPLTAALVPLNDAGIGALIALQTDYANKHGIAFADAQNVTNVAELGLTLAGDKKAVAFIKSDLPNLAATVSAK